MQIVRPRAIKPSNAAIVEGRLRATKATGAWGCAPLASINAASRSATRRISPQVRHSPWYSMTGWAGGRSRACAQSVWRLLISAGIKTNGINFAKS
jgi:hypothetical protein